MTKTCPPTSLGHTSHPYRKGNSVQGIHMYVAAPYKWGDFDWQESRDHRLWNMHWPRLYQDKFKIAGKPLSGPRRVKSLSDHALSRVHSPEMYKPHKDSLMIKLLAASGLYLEAELKVAASDLALRRFLTEIAVQQKLHPDWQVRVKILWGVLGRRKLIDTLGRVKKIAAEVGANVDTMLLNHKHFPIKLNAEAREKVDLVRGKWVAV
jgi:hypothetical protein